MMEIRSSERNGVKLRWRVVSGREIVEGVAEPQRPNLPSWANMSTGHTLFLMAVDAEISIASSRPLRLGI